MFCTPRLKAAGVTPYSLRAMRGGAVRIRRGYYATDPLEGWESYRMRCLAVLESLRPSAALAGPSAALFWDLPLVGEPPARVYVRGVTRGSYGKDVKVVVGGAAEVEEVGGVRCASIPWTVADCARLLSRRDALIVADAALHARLCRFEKLAAVRDELRGATGVGHVRWVIDNADPASESAGETWTRMVVKELGYAVVSQMGVDRYRIDLVIEGTRVGLEFDGVLKYPGRSAERSPQDVIVGEKQRQARLEELGYVVLRVIWVQLFEPAVLDRRIRNALQGRALGTS